MNNHSSIATEAGPDVTEMNAMILMELEDAKKAMSNVTDSGQPDLGSHNVGNYLTSVPLATMDHYDNVGSEYQGVEDDDGAMALRGGGEDKEGDNEDDYDDVMPMTFDHLKFQDEDDLDGTPLFYSGCRIFCIQNRFFITSLRAEYSARKIDFLLK